MLYLKGKDLNPMPNLVTERFVRCHDHLKSEGKIKSSRQFAKSLDFQPQNLSEILRGKRDAPTSLIRKSVEIYRFNPLYLFAGEGTMFLEGEEMSFRVHTIVTDNDNNERIVHIPVPAQAGYSQDFIEPFLETLPSYSLPGLKYRQGSYRSFDVAGDSMEPTLDAGDQVICSFVEPNLWLTGIRDHHVYVVVTRSGLFVKRVINNLHKHRHLELRSDNPFYRTTRINVGEVKELWLVTSVLKNFCHSLPEPSRNATSYEALEETIGQQFMLINSLHKKIEQLMPNVQDQREGRI